MIDTPLPQNEPVVLPARPFGRVARSVVAHGVATGLMAGSPLLVFVPAAIFHCGARNGRRATWIAFAIAFALFAGQTAVVAAQKPATADQSWMFFTGLMLAVALPASLAFPLVERAANFGRTLMVLLAGAGIGLGATELALRQIRSFSAYAVTVSSAQEMLTQVLQMNRVKPLPSLLMSVVSLICDSRVQSAIAMIDITLVFAVSLLMIGRLRAWRESVAVRVGPEALGAYLFRNFALPEWVLLAFVFGGITPFTTGLVQTLAANVLTLVTFLYVLQGLAIYRALLMSTGAGVGSTILGWMLVMFTMPFGGWLLLAIAGLFDPFFDFRHFKRKDDSHESHTD